MRFRLISAVCTILLYLPACNKPKDVDHPPTVPGKLPNFSVVVLERTPARAIIQWDSCINTINSDTVKYKVILNNNVVKYNLATLTDTLRNLEKDKIYSGKVVAYISSGDTTFAEFTLSTYEGFIYAYTNSPSLGCFNAYPTRGLQVQPFIWRQNTGVVLLPTLSNDTMFLVVDKRMKAIDATTGSNIWQGPATIDFNTPVTYNKGKLFACAATGELVCLNSSNGQLLWTYRSTLSYVNFNSTPVLGSDIVFVASTDESSGEVHGINALTGQNIWSYTIYNSICKRPLAVDGILVISSGYSGRVFALDQGNGNVLWDRSDFGKVGLDWFNPVYTDGKVLVNTIGSLYALDPKTGKNTWVYETSNHLLDCVAGNGMIYFCQDSIGQAQTYSDYQFVKCISAKDGHLVWKRGSLNEVYSQLVFAKDKIYCLYDYTFSASSNPIVALNARDGNLDTDFLNYNPVSLSSYENVENFFIKRDGVICYPSSHGNYQSQE